VLISGFFRKTGQSPAAIEAFRNVRRFIIIKSNVRISNSSWLP
jgi:hypothetical protein